jgi:hypothetical protein
LACISEEGHIHLRPVAVPDKSQRVPIPMADPELVEGGRKVDLSPPASETGGIGPCWICEL